MMAGITDNDKSEIKTLAKYISAQSTDTDNHFPFASVGKPNTCFNVGSDDTLIRVSYFDGASQLVVTTSLCPRLLHLCHCSPSAGPLVNVEYKTP